MVYGMGGGMMGGGGFGGPITSPIYQATTPDVRTEIVKSLVTMGDKAAPAIPELLKIMEKVTNIDVDNFGGGRYRGVVIRMMKEGGPSEQMASDFMVKCFMVIKNCRAKEAIPLLTKDVNGRERGDYADALWRSTAEETLSALDPSAVSNGYSLPGGLNEDLEDSGETEEEDQESKPPPVEPVGARQRGLGEGNAETPSIELDGGTPL